MSRPSGLVVSKGYFCPCPAVYWSSDIWHAITSQDLQASSNCVVIVFSWITMVVKLTSWGWYNSEHCYSKFTSAIDMFRFFPSVSFWKGQIRIKDCFSLAWSCKKVGHWWEQQQMYICQICSNKNHWVLFLMNTFNIKKQQ